MKKFGLLGLVFAFFAGLFVANVFTDLGDRWAVKDGVGPDANFAWRITSSGDLVPGVDDSYSFGSSSLAPDVMYLGEAVVTVAVTTTTATPAALGALVRSDIDTGDLFIATGTAAGAWEKVGAQ